MGLPTCGHPCDTEVERIRSPSLLGSCAPVIICEASVRIEVDGTTM